MRQRYVTLILAVVLAGLVAAVAFQAIGQEGRKDSLYRQYDRLIRVVHEVKKRYIREVDDDEIFTDAINGMLHGLDPFSSYIPSDKLDQFKKMTMGKFSGIGIQIGMRAGRLTVISPLEDTPAFKAGVLAGDVITEIDGVSTEGITLEDAVKKLTGKPGTNVTITVYHQARKKEEKITITRAMIKIKSVKGYQRDEDGNWEYFIDPKNKIAYVRITSFVGPTDTNANRATGGTVYELREAMTKLQKEGMKSLILDLRFNPGGLLISATQTVDMFVEKGLIISRKGRVGPNVVINATKKDTISDVPIVVLISSFSASGAEILAGALADHNRAILVGERTYGKGSVQDVVYLDDGNNGKAALKLTTSKYYLPNGVCIHREKGMTKDDEWGVNPHITVKMSPMEYAQILSARREADVIPGNDHNANAEDKEPAGDEEKKPEEPKDSSGETTEAPSPDEPKAEPGDRQLQRALDVLRAMDVMKSYLKAG